MAAVTFDSNLSLIEVTRMSDNPKLVSVCCMRRHSRSNALFVGTYEYILVVAWIGSRFYLLQEIPTSIVNPIVDLAYREGELFAVSDFDQAMVVLFPNVQRQKSPANPTTSFEPP